MSVGGAIRRSCYWRRDRKKNGGKMYNAYSEILSEMNDGYNASGASEKLEKLVRHAVTTTEFYKNFPEDFNSFPVINKNTVIENRNQMFSKEYMNEPLHEMHTSGSTGIPFAMQQDMNKRSRVIAEIKATNEFADYPSHERMLYFIGSSRKGRHYYPGQELCENIWRIEAITGDDRSMESVAAFIRKRRPRTIQACVSQIVPFIDYCKRNNITFKRCPVKSIITGGEMVPVQFRKDLEELLPGCKVYAKYSNEEMGIYGVDNGVDTPYLLNTTDYYFEIFKMDRDEPADEGAFGRIIITDLYNYAIPLIRYDTGDLGTVKMMNGKKYLVDLSGKSRDLLYNTRGDAVSGSTVTCVMRYLKNVRMFQLIQETRNEYTLKYVSGDTEPSDEDLQIKELQELFGEDAVITKEKTDDIPLISSAKRRYTVNNMKKA